MTTDIQHIVDIDRPATWPSVLTEFVGTWASKLNGTTEYTNDLNVPLEEEDHIREILTAGRLLRSYHCTRLLPHEVQMIRRQGLRLLSARLMRDRIDAAQYSGSLTKDEADGLHKAHVFATGESQYRDERVCLVLSDTIFRESPGSVKPLMDSWGGEAMSMSSGAAKYLARLKEIGTPSVVSTLIDVGGSGSRHRFYPSLHKAFIGSAIGLRDYSADVHFLDLIGPEQIEAIWGPEDEAFVRLWRTD